MALTLISVNETWHWNEYRVIMPFNIDNMLLKTNLIFWEKKWIKHLGFLTHQIPYYVTIEKNVYVHEYITARLTFFPFTCITNNLWMKDFGTLLVPNFGDQPHFLICNSRLFDFKRLFFFYSITVFSIFFII